MSRFIVGTAIVLVVVVLVWVGITVRKWMRDRREVDIARLDPALLEHADASTQMLQLLADRQATIKSLSKILWQMLEDPVVQSTLSSEYYDPIKTELLRLREQEGTKR